MPFQQPTSLIIRQYHFRGKAFTFPVETTLASESNGGQLHISVSDGYSLKTSLNDSPQDRQILDYIKQADGSWLVRSTITLIATAPSLLSGAVTLRDPLGTTLRITITIEPTLFIDDSPIFFDSTKLGKRTAAQLTIRQQGAVTPINLRIDAARAFTIANTKMAFVTSNGLSITPSFEGTHVIINYTPIQAGHHNAHLVVNTPYDTKTIPLIGQTSGLSGWLPKLSMPTLFTNTNPLFTLPTLRRGHLIGASIFLGVLGLVWGSYVLLSQSKNTVDLAVLAKQPANLTRQAAAFINHKSKPANQPLQNDLLASNDHKEKPAHQTNISQSNQEKLTDYIKSTPIVSTKPKPTPQAKPILTAQTKAEQITQAKIPVASVDEISELEQELNTPVSHKGRP